MHLVPADRAKPEIPVVALLASVRANQQECTNHSFQRAPPSRPAHRITAAPRTVILFPQL